MPVHVRKRGKKYRVVDADGSLTRNTAGTAVDGGGSKNLNKVQRQVNAININIYKQNQKKAD